MLIKGAYSIFLAWGATALGFMLHFIIQWAMSEPSPVKWEGAIPVGFMFALGLPAWLFLLILASEIRDGIWNRLKMCGKSIAFISIVIGLCALLAAA